MATNLTVTGKIEGNLIYLNDLDLADPTVSLPLRTAIELANGTGANQADMAWWDTRSLAGGANETLDLAGAGGNISGPYGGTSAVGFVFARLKLILIRNTSTVASSILSIGAAAQPIPLFGAGTDSLKIPPGGCTLLFAPDATAYAITGGVADQLKITNAAGGAATYDIVLVGCSA